jgi:hypothetical protein
MSVYRHNSLLQYCKAGSCIYNTLLWIYKYILAMIFLRIIIMGEFFEEMGKRQLVNRLHSFNSLVKATPSTHLGVGSIILN